MRCPREPQERVGVERVRRERRMEGRVWRCIMDAVAFRGRINESGRHCGLLIWLQ